MLLVPAPQPAYLPFAPSVSCLSASKLCAVISLCVVISWQHRPSSDLERPISKAHLSGNPVSSLKSQVPDPRETRTLLSRAPMLDTRTTSYREHDHIASHLRAYYEWGPVMQYHKETGFRRLGLDSWALFLRGWGWLVCVSSS